MVYRQSKNRNHFDDEGIIHLIITTVRQKRYSPLKHLLIAGISPSPSERGWGEANKSETNVDSTFKVTKNITRTVVFNYSLNECQMK